MNLRITKDEAKALSYLRNSQEFNVFSTFIEKSLDKLRKESDILIEIDDIRKSQGARIILNELLRQINDSTKILERYETNES